jgi:hypothetical protein
MVNDGQMCCGARLTDDCRTSYTKTVTKKGAPTSVFDGAAVTTGVVQ